MKKSNLCSSALLWVLVLATGYAQAQAPTAKNHSGKAVQDKAKVRANASSFNLPSESKSLRFSYSAGSQLNKPPGGLPGWVNAKIKGAGTLGTIPVFTGGTNIGDSIITQASGVISIGGALTTNGIITTSGGIRFPDGSLQTTAASGGGGGGGFGFSLPFEGTTNSSGPAFLVTNTLGIGVEGASTNAAGVRGRSTGGVGVAGVSTSGTGVDGISTSGGTGVFGGSTTGAGVRGESNSSEGVVGSSQSSVGVFGTSNSSFGVGGSSSSGTAVSGQSVSGIGVRGSTSNSAIGVLGESGVGGTGVRGIAGTGGIGVVGQSGTNGIGVVGQTAEAPVVTASDRAGVVGASNNDFGVRGRSINFNGVSGSSVGGNGVVADSIANFAALFAINNSGAGSASHGISGVSRTGVGVRGESQTGLAGAFVGNVQVTGNLSKGGGSFKIDHPLDPENKYLYHSFVESPDMMNIYNGNITTDENGDASVILPDYFDVLNQDFRYQLTVIGVFAQAIVATEVENNRFTIRTTGPNVKVSWQVTGVRKDPYAKKHRIPVEEEKAEQERGYYLHPEAYGQPEDKNVEWAKEPEETRQLRKAMIDSGVSPKSVPPPGSGALIVPERSIKQ